MKYAFIFFMAVLAAGCNSAPAKVDPASTPGTASQSATTSSGDKGTDIMVEITGGPNAGIYKASVNESSCSMGLTGVNSFGNQYSVTGKGDKELSSLQMIADNYEEAKKGTSNFNAQFGFGSLVNGNSYSLDPSKSMGTGKLTITESGGSKTATIEGKTKEGIDIKAVITCKTTQKMVDGQLKEE